MDLHNLDRKQARIVTGVHFYLDVVNFKDLLEDAREDAQKLRRFLRHIHVYERLAGKLLDEVDGGFRVHFQGVRLHGLVHKPYDTTDVSDPELKRLFAAYQYVKQASALAKLIEEETEFDFKLEAGIESGGTIATRNGQNGSAELLFLGQAANDAAKALKGEEDEVHFGEEAAKRDGDLDDPAPLPEKWKNIVKEDAANNPISQFETFVPRERLDYETLGVRTGDLDPGITFFADISGFTRHVATLESDEEKKQALRSFHAARSEMHQIVVKDYDGDFIQFQGDRIQGLVYEAGASRRFAKKSIEAAAAMQDAFGLFEEILLDFADLGVTTGVASGRVFVTQVGRKGDREVLVLGNSVAAASQLQDGCASGETAINGALRDLLPEHLQEIFKAEEGDQDRYVAAELGLATLEAAKDAQAYGGLVEVKSTPSGAFRVAPASGSAGIQPATSYLSRNAKPRRR
jgi:class 3 adenylate cyclase